MYKHATIRSILYPTILLEYESNIPRNFEEISSWPHVLTRLLCALFIITILLNK